MHPNVKILQSTTCIAHLFQSSDTRVDQILGNAESERKAVEQRLNDTSKIAYRACIWAWPCFCVAGS